ncbi:TonB-dependent receptor domain-containing protein [Helicobacter burdigaliensis]|uniref:TonB-dependent receptor domain-containing protein n=1 Tax=Helicobacter burdigaliensis TaxID=2315334 RepID=UPI000EF65933|nr:TonB-dependent receptor [Helicobacter burdigaliensis]
MKKYFRGALALAFCGASLNAVESYNLDTSVVSATGFEQDVKDAPASISVISKEELESKPFKDIGEALMGLPGVDVSMNKLGSYDFSIRGFSSSSGYVLVLVDGKRQNSVQGLYDDGFGGVESNFLPPLSMIERIEVIRGPASTLYGGDAVGGVVNIITKKNPSTFVGSFSFDNTFVQHPDINGSSRGVNGYMAFPLVKDTLSLALRAKYYTKGDTAITTPSRDYASHSAGEMRMGNVGAKLNWTINESNNVYLDLEHSLAYTASLSSSSAGTYSPRDVIKNRVLLNHDGNYGFGSINTYFQSNLTDDKTTDAQGETYILETKSVLPFELGKYGATTLSSGIQYMHEMYVNNNTDAKYKEIRGKEFKQNTIAPYAEAEYYITDDLIVTGGLRYTHSDLFNGELTPRGYLVYHLTDLITLKGGIAKGYRTPEVRQLFDGIYRLNNRNQQGVYGNPDLKPETSTNYEIGAIFEVPRWGNLSLTAFQTDFKNAIEYKEYAEGATLPNGGICNGPTGDPTYDKACRYFENVGKTQVKGIELGMQSAKWYGVSVDASYTFMDKKYKSGVDSGKRFVDTPRHIAMLKLNYTKGRFSSYLKGTGRYDSLIEEGKKYNDYYVVDLGASFKLTKNSQVSFAINNLFDKDFYDPYATIGKGGAISYSNAYQDYLDGRNFWLSYKLDF